MPVTCEPCQLPVRRVSYHTTTEGFWAPSVRCVGCGYCFCNLHHRVSPREVTWRPRLGRYGQEVSTPICTDEPCLSRWTDFQAGRQDEESRRLLKAQAEVDAYHAEVAKWQEDAAGRSAYPWLDDELVYLEMRDLIEQL